MTPYSFKQPFVQSSPTFIIFITPLSESEAFDYYPVKDRCVNHSYAIIRRRLQQADATAASTDVTCATAAAMTAERTT